MKSLRFRSLLLNIQNPAGLTLVELVAGIFVLSFLTLTTSTLLYQMSHNQAMTIKTHNRTQLTAQILNQARNPSTVKRSLTAVASCFNNPTDICNVTAPTGFDLAETTQASGQICYRESGEKCAAPSVCGNDCPIEVQTQYEITCPGGTGARTSCASSQSLVKIHYRIQPFASVHSEKKFYPVVGIQILKPENLYDTGKSIEIQSKKFNSSFNATTTCSAGEVMVGVESDGTALCKRIAYTCPPGHLLTGYNITGGAGYTFTPKCTDVRCPLVGGKKQVLQGIDPITNAPICKPLNSSSAPCVAYDGVGMPNGYFMAGLDVNGDPMCRKKTCLPGEIFARWDPAGNAVCVSTNFIPKCSVDGTGGGVTCSSPPSSTPPASPHHYPHGSVALGYEGVPYISEWIDGEPTKGARQAYDNWASGYSSTARSFFVPTPDRRGSTKTTGTTVTTCQTSAAPNNLTCTHTWEVVTRQDGTCPSGPGINASYIGGNTCQIYRWDCTAALVFNAALGIWECPAAYGWVPDHTEQSEITQTYTNSGAALSASFTGTGYSASCNDTEPHHAWVGNPGGTLGTRKNSRYYDFNIIAGCNYEYRK